MQNSQLKKVINGILFVLIFCLLISIIILAWVPPVSRDALIHHLAVPKLWIKHGGIYEMPELSFSYYPMNIDLLYVIPLIFGNDIIPKLIHFGFALLTALFIFRYLQKRIDPAYAGVGALLFLSTPIIIRLSISAYVDLGLLFFAWISIIHLFKWRENGYPRKRLVLSGLFCGLALGSKYIGLIVLFLLAMFVPFMYLRSESRQAISQKNAAVFAVIFSAAALLTFSPWMIRNTIWTGNPTYPLFQTLFNKQESPVEILQSNHTPAHQRQSKTMKKARWRHFEIRKYVYQENVGQILTIPVRIFFQGKDDAPKYFDGRLNPFLFVLPFFAFIGIRKDEHLVKGEKVFLTSFAILFLLIVFFMADMRIRYVSPIIAPLVVLSSYAVFNLVQLGNGMRSRHAKWLLKVFVFVGIGIMFFLNGSYLVEQYRIVNPLPYIRGQLDRGAYITRYRSEYPVFQYANKHLPADTKILGVFIGKRGYYCERDIIFNFSFIKKSVKGSDDTGQLEREFNKRSITHLIVRFDLFNKWANDSFNGKQKKTLVEFFNRRTRTLYSEKGHGLMELL